MTSVFSKRSKHLHTAENLEPYDISADDLKQLMKLREENLTQKIEILGKTEGLCRLLHSSPDKGICSKGSRIRLEEDEEYTRRREIFGPNYLPPVSQTTFMCLVWHAMKDATLIILEASAIISMVLSFVTMGSDDTIDQNESNSWIEGLSIMICVMVVVLVTACNNYTKERQFKALQKRIDLEHKHDVIRNGQVQQVLVRNIVVGDICRVKYGDLLPADGLIISSNDLKVDESTLTGESEFVRKNQETNPLLFSGTKIMEGSAKMLVTAVGINSQAGIIYMLLNENKVSSERKRRKKAKQKNKKNKSVKNVEEQNLQTVESSNKSVLQIKLFKMAMTIGYIGLAFATATTLILAIIFSIETYHVRNEHWHASHARDFLEFFIIGVTILVVAVPEGLPLAVTLSLAYSVKKMMRDNNLVRHIDACETMGNATTICCDKTGTLTMNRMIVVETFLCEVRYLMPEPNYEDIPQVVVAILLQAIAVNSNYGSKFMPTASGRSEMVGNVTECALLQFISRMRQDYDAIRNSHPEDSFVRVYTFNSIRKSMSTVIRNVAGGYRLLTKGASEIILRKCSSFYGETGVLKNFTPEVYTEWTLEVIVPMASSGLRTIAVAYRDFETPAEPDWDDEEAVVADLTCLALFGIQDPVREEVPEAIRSCVKAGITVRMVTGDNVNTATAVAKKCGILAQKQYDISTKSAHANEPGKAMQGMIMETEEFNRRIRDENGIVKQELMDEVWPNLLVLARSSPTDKYNLVRGIIESKISTYREVVAVTGDGTNDGPALKKADVGFAMGITGTDVAKEAADIIITDDNFESIVKAVSWGRNIYDSICKFLQFQLTANVVACLVCVVSACGAQNTPLKTVQILWINMVMDTLASLALATELPTPDLLNRKPYGRTKHLISNMMLKNIIGQSVYQLAVLLALVFVGANLFKIPSGIGVYVTKPTQHYTVVFNAFVMMILFNEFNSRKLHGERNVFKGVFKNPVFYGIWIGSFLAQIIIVEFGFWVFATTGLNIVQWTVCLGLGASTLLWQQILITIPYPKKSG